MTVPSAAHAPAGGPRSARGWLFGPAPDLLLGCGVLYAALFAAQIFFEPGLRRIAPPDSHLYLTLLFGAPHYGATLLRVYQRPEDRRRYRFFAVHVAIIMVALFVAGLHWLFLGSLLVTIFLTWSPWHYSGQNYGITLMMLGRRGVGVSAAAKSWLRTSFRLSFALVLVVIHGTAPGAIYAPSPSHEGAYHFISLGIPAPIADGLFLVLLAGWLVATVGAAVLVLRPGARIGAVAPAAVLVVVQALWFVAPSIARRFPEIAGIGPLEASNAAYAFMWIGFGHFVQYLWITSYYARSSGEGSRVPVFLGKALVAGTALFTVPLLLFAPGRLGSIPVGAGLALLSAAVLNIHHFILDGAIWRLRDGAVARILLRPPEPHEIRAPSARRFAVPLGAAAWAVGIAVLGARWAIDAERRAFNEAARRDDVPRVLQSIDRLTLAGFRSPSHDVSLARLALQVGSVARAREHLARSIAFFPTAEAYLLLGKVSEREGDWRGALDAYRSATERDPSDVQALLNAGRMLLRLGEVVEAEDHFARAQALAPESVTLARLREEARLAISNSQGASAAQTP
jgi:hypothetical protein